MAASHERKDVLPPFFDRFLKHDLLMFEDEQALARYVRPGRSGTPSYIVVENRRGRPRHCPVRKRTRRGRPSSDALRITRPASGQKVFGIVHVSVEAKDALGITPYGGDIELHVFRKHRRFPSTVLPLRHDRRWGWYARLNTATLGNGEWRLESHISVPLALRATHVFMAHNYRFVLGVARKYLWSGLPLEDIFSAGVTGLQTAVDKFDPALGYRFNTYATWWIRQAIARFVRDTSRTIRIPNQQWDRNHHIRTALKEFGEAAPPKTVAAYVSGKSGKEITPEMIEETKAHFGLQVLPLNMPSGTDNGFSTLDVIPDNTPGQLDHVLDAESVAIVRNALGDLTPREREIISLRYGLDDGEVRTLQEIGERFGVSRERVRQIETNILEKLATRIDRDAP